MSDHDTWEDEGGSIEEDWPYDEDGDWIEEDLIEGWDEIDDVDDYRHVDERDF